MSTFAGYLTKVFHNVSNFILKYPCQFQLDIPVNARVVAVQRGN